MQQCRELTFCCSNGFSIAKQRLEMNDDLFRSDESSLDNNFDCNEFFAVCTSPKSIDENKQRSRCLSASKPNCLQSYKNEIMTYNRMIKLFTQGERVREKMSETKKTCTRT